jgi:hypothetical protein
MSNSNAYRDWRRRVALHVKGPISGELQRYFTVEEAIEAARLLMLEYPRFGYLIEENGVWVWDSEKDALCGWREKGRES